MPVFVKSMDNKANEENLREKPIFELSERFLDDVVATLNPMSTNSFRSDVHLKSRDTTT
jgi:hypothetical protein